MQLKSYDVLSVKQYRFSELNLDDVFFDSLKTDYPGFSDWFLRKGGEKAFVVKNEEGIQAFLYMKIEDPNEDYSHFEKILDPAKRLKVGTFKISQNGYYLGERFFRIILEHAIINNVEEIYVTIFPNREEQKKLISFMKEFGFNLYTKNKKTNEQVYIRKMNIILNAEPSLNNYPYIAKNSSRNYFLLCIDSVYHTKLIPDSIIREENPNDFTSKITAANAIQKIYIGNYRISPQPGDIIIYYRMKPEGDKRAARFATTLTGFGIVSEAYKNIKSFEDVEKIVSKRTVLTEKEIKQKLANHKYGVNILKFYDIYSFKKRPIRQFLLENDILGDNDYPTKKISEQDFDLILKEAKFSKNIIFI
ncbi:hypothetical protein [Bacillus sp. UNC438CL73TsuS30]|uniref:hypothetical protein n=1 Tax=Bacillus sp. UNC438CL73TsuS30 TaxID=1340434 RepID=UPI0006914523|nr:hypothetical protein [Bacillus sp. UNC438CL73TsuS30]